MPGWGATLSRMRQPTTVTITPGTDGAVGACGPHGAAPVAAVSEARLRTLAAPLVAFGTRESLSTTASPTRGVGAARQWIFDELMRPSPTLQVSFDTDVIAPQGRLPRQTELRNVMAGLPGRTARHIDITGHYDSLILGSGGQQALNAGGVQNPQRTAANRRCAKRDIRSATKGTCCKDRA